MSAMIYKGNIVEVARISRGAAIAQLASGEWVPLGMLDAIPVAAYQAAKQTKAKKDAADSN